MQTHTYILTYIHTVHANTTFSTCTDAHSVCIMYICTYTVHTSYIYVSIVQYKQYTCLTCIPRSSHVTIMWPSCDHYSFLHCRSSPTQQARRALPAVFHKVKNITKRYLYSYSTCLCVTTVHVLYWWTCVYIKVWTVQSGYMELITLTWLKFLHTSQNDSQFSGASVVFVYSFTDQGYCRYNACGRKAGCWEIS